MPEFDITQALTVDDIESVPEPFRPLYAAKDGKHSIPDTNKGIVEFIGNLNRNLTAARGENKTLKGKVIDLSPLSEYGNTPADIAEKVKETIEGIQAEAAKGKPNLEKIKQDLAAGFAEEGKKKDTRIEALKGQLYNLLVESAGVTAISELKGVPDLLMPLIKQKVKVTEEDGKFTVSVIDAAGDVRYSGATGQPMTIKELVAEMKKDPKYGRVFESDTNSGGGKQTNSSQTQVKHSQDQDKLRGVSKIAAGFDKRN